MKAHQGHILIFSIVIIHITNTINNNNYNDNNDNNNSNTYNTPAVLHGVLPRDTY